MPAGPDVFLPSPQTSAPDDVSRRHNAAPMNPAAPVTTHRRPCQSAFVAAVSGRSFIVSRESRGDRSLAEAKLAGMKSFGPPGRRSGLDASQSHDRLEGLRCEPRLLELRPIAAHQDTQLPLDYRLF